MIDEIFEMIMKEARSRKGPSLETDIMMVLFELSDKVCDVIQTIKVDKIKRTRLTFRRKQQ